jgi:hypothetical protein
MTLGEFIIRTGDPGLTKAVSDLMARVYTRGGTDGRRGLPGSWPPGPEQPAAGSDRGDGRLGMAGLFRL